MTSPVETIADALIAFILSLLKDPDAVEEFAARPAATLEQHGLQGVCMADVNAVRPVIVDHPRVVHHSSPPPPPPEGPDDHETVREIIRMVQQYTTIDARSTIVDQSVNQNIWTEGGDVTQIFDQEAAVASGDDSIAAGDDVSVVDSDTDVSMGDVSIGNETNDGSFNDTGGSDDSEVVDEETDEAMAPPDPADTSSGDPLPDTPSDAVETATGAAVDAADTAVAATTQPAAPPPPPADVPEPADLLESDLAADSGDTYEADTASATVDDAPVDMPVDDN